ncbi:uncharacterized protein LOC106133662 [Amyelois transitella]|uniref:uncharacterized protein LOC106133662 n=1 Tax=Amyelois transitella TaxID=680683 RepID=UPI00298FC228|nr:uncharacterized protein LOC106133662 [Amyelois transitella]
MVEVTNVLPAGKPESSIGMRHVITLLLFLATTVSYATRVSMSVAIVAMTSDNDYGYPVFDWDKGVQDTILSSFFWGYIVLQVPAGMLAGKFGGKFLILAAMIATGIVNLLVPIAAVHGGWTAVCGCRIAMGLTQGLLYPSLHGFLGHWAPVNERSRLGTYVYAGAQLGTIVEMMTSSLLSASRWGWPSVFYVAGLTCLVWSGLWLFLGASTPGTSKWISKEERKYIETSAGSDEIGTHKNMSTPWKSIWTSLPFWAILLAHCGQSLGFWTLLTELPSYMANVLNVNIKNNGLLSALPYVAMYILSFIFSWTSDFLVNRNIISSVTSRKIFNTIAFWGPAAALLVLSYLPPGHLTLAVVILTFTVGLNGAHYVGFMMSHIDLSPNFASVMMGITNGFGGVFSIMAPLSVSAVIKDQTQASEWRKVFFISIALYFFCNLFYIIFISGDLQPWNEPKQKSDEEDGTKNETEKEENVNFLTLSSINSSFNFWNVASWGVRHKQCVILMVALTIAYSLRACMGVALVGMIETSPVSEIPNGSNVNVSRNETEYGLNVRGADYVAHGFLNALMLVPPYPQFDWSKKVQDTVISAFFFGYMLLQIPGGQLAHRFGAKKLIASAMFINCAASVLFPTVTFYGGWITAALFRMIQGLAQACIMPSTHTFLGKWTPLEERGRLSGMIYGAQALGPVLGLPLTGFIASSPLGWPGIFRFYGVLSGICGAIIWFFCADSPAQHKNISAAERNYIEEALRQKGEASTKRHKVPWSRLLCHRGLYAIIVAHIGQTWGQLTLYSEVPAFMDKVMEVNIKANGLLSALPFLVMFFTNFFFSWFFDMIIVKKYIGVTWARKLAQTIGCMGSSIGLIILAYAPQDIYVVETIMVILCGMKIACHYGFLVNHIDISPNFAGTMMSLSNFCSNCVGVLAPIVAGIILTDVTSVFLWRKVFFVSSGLYFFSNVVYVILGTSELADWNEPEQTKNDEEEHAMIKKEHKK